MINVIKLFYLRFFFFGNERFVEKLNNRYSKRSIANNIITNFN